jgi:hypothetical protein
MLERFGPQLSLTGEAKGMGWRVAAGWQNQNPFSFSSNETTILFKAN